MDLDALDALAKEVASFKESVRSISEDLNAEKERAVEADSALAEWEDKVRACKETTAVVNAERGRDGELETLRCKCFNISQGMDESLIVHLRAFFSAELHRLELRSDAVDKQTRGLVEILESTVWRRDAMAEKAAARRASLTCSGSSMGSPKTPQLGHNSVMS